ncbi:MAG: helix-turn-helix domain-containing protein [Paraburkholderia tropica]|uniref:HxlR family transcriptional regulator n=1 Tax=Paraburkholderia tropica TaxID=92647 RepID=A0ABX5MSV8_9BURK|nr:helix-turn-helix domain-containing protein [Paraburkholderia tropica]MBB3003365.1 DNA-binding HxlR family transcriptional regulator [Paraburkholderia tropica]MBB6322381.1 DNA-binding HxlR family transcriptional regulator [Paraburkholderia tropica]MDE1140065.1 helix-turn-helix domain-containing protein [Paraburkholderia tropica]PXX18000.1 HxlR family transcriptional regulator [Paraburkholderia tropica]PZW85982.1 HxlR family transcriptional regulator [Paraburkholderia tropica]
MSPLPLKPDCRQHFSVDCPSRLLIDQIADKWSMMILTVLDAGPMRFNAIKRHLEGVTQKALTQCLRRLERNGLVSRRVIPVSPVAVEYEITQLGRSLQGPFRALYAWTLHNLDAVDIARAAFDARAASEVSER